MPKTLAEGSKAPAFSLPNDQGSTVTLNGLKGQNVVLYFIPEGQHPGLH